MYSRFFDLSQLALGNQNEVSDESNVRTVSVDSITGRNANIHSLRLRRHLEH